MDPRQISISYLKSWFFVDFMSSVPIDYILSALGGSEVRGEREGWSREKKTLFMSDILDTDDLVGVMALS